MTKKLFIPANPNATNSELDAKVIIKNISTRRELIANDLLEVVDDYPDQLRVIVDELVSLLSHTQLDEVEDLIVNNYCEEN
tara:strand:- start:252 stop:494 length:243 start_codon:yes stop_codon:yes gene_type:complete